MSLGFIHGVMNTDNMTISGETIDYGPCAFMDAYHPMTVFSSIDQGGRYAYANQPRIAQWNLACLAQSLLPLMEGDERARIAVAQEVVNRYSETFETAWLAEMRAKLGLEGEQDGDAALIEDLFSLMADAEADFTLTFRGLADGSAREQFADARGFDDWATTWRARGGTEGPMLERVNPLFIPRNHRVEAAIAAGLSGNFEPFEDLVAVLLAPFDSQPDRIDFSHPARPDERVLRTFCGT